MKKNRRLTAFLLLLFAVLMSIPWLVPHTGPLALVGLVPLLCADRLERGTGIKGFFWWYYAAFALWNALTTFWVCNATVGGGIFAILANAFQMSLIFALFRFSFRRFSGVLPYVLLAAGWIAWERLYFGAEISWPWLTLGYAFAESTNLVQWYSVTGVLGGSLWIWLVNLSLFAVMTMLSDGSWFGRSSRSRASICALVFLLVAAPVGTSLVQCAVVPERSEAVVSAAALQPNFDPYQKFTSLSQEEQTEKLLALVENKCPLEDSVSLFVAPETFTSDIWLNDVRQSPCFSSICEFLEDRTSSSFIFGASAHEFFTSKSSPDLLAFKSGGGWVTSYNSALVAYPDSDFQICHKGKLVVGTELTPYPAVFTRVDAFLCRVMGVAGPLMGRCSGAEHPSVLELQDGTRIGCAICYESVYGEYCAEYVRQGAKALAVITNDAWWGDTPGYRQHLSYSRIRAIELRRDIVRSANTGISAFIDQKGRVVSRTEWWKEDCLRGEINLNSVQTVFAKYGDIIGKACTLSFVLLLLALAVRLFTRKD